MDTGPSGDSAAPADSDAEPTDSDTDPSGDSAEPSRCGEADACDDGDACTTDVCDEATGTCSNTVFSGTALDLWDMDWLRDASTLDLEILSSETVWEGLVPVQIDEIRFSSWEVDGCVERPITLEAFVATPLTGEASYPGLVVAHGLGGMADAGVVSGPAGSLGVITLAWSGPGQGSSEGTTCSPDHLFDTAGDPRESWFWEHTAAGIRGLTVLESWPGVDTSRLGVTGYSAGGLVSLMMNGLDDRVTTSVPISASGYLDLAAAATPTPGWEVDLLAAMVPPRTTADVEWTNYVAFLDAKNYLPTAHGDVLLINGAQDEFFPIHSTVSTFSDLEAAAVETRLLHIKDWDHGWYALYTSEESAAKTEASWAYFFEHGFELDPDLTELAPQPEIVDVVPWTCFYPDAPWITWSCALVAATLSSPTDYTVEDVAFHWSVDGSLTYASWNLDYDAATDLWYAEVGTLDGAVYDDSNTVWFVEATFSAGLFGPSWSLSSAANIPPGFSPNIIPIAGPVP